VLFDGSQNVVINTTLTNTYTKTINNQVPDINGNITITLSGGSSYLSGTGIALTNNIISLTDTGISPGLYQNVEVDIYGRIVSGAPVLI